MLDRSDRRVHALDRAAAVAVSERVLAWLRADGGALEADDGVRWTEAHRAAAERAIEVHGVGPLLHRTLGSRPAGRAGDSLRAFVAHTAALNTARAAVWRTELDRVLQAARAHAVPVLPLKSAALVLGGLDDPALRPTADIDLLVAPEAIDRAGRAWLDLGYALEGVAPSHRLYYLHRLGTAARSPFGEDPGNPLRLDVHTSVRKSMIVASADPTPALWAEAAPAPGAAAPAQLPSPAALLLHLAAHAANDLFFGAARWLTLRDLRLAAARGTAADWTRLLRAAHDAHAERAFFAALCLAERYAGAAVPGDVLQELARATPPGLRDHLERVTLSEMSHVVERRTLPAVRRMLHWTRPGRERLVAARRLLLPTPAEWAARLGSDATRGRFWYIARLGRSMLAVMGRGTGARTP